MGMILAVIFLFLYPSLRITPDDPDPVAAERNSEFLKNLDDIHTAFGNAEHKKALDQVYDLKKVAVQMLKAEWKRVKDGEPTYQNSIARANTLIAVAVGAALFTSIVWILP